MRTLLLLCIGLPALGVGCGDDGASEADDGAGLEDATAESDVGPEADAEAGPEDAGREDAFEVPPAPVTVAPAVELLRAADPKLPGFDGWPLAFDVDPAGRTGLRCRVVLARATGELGRVEADITSRRCAVAWSGRAPDGSWLSPGPLTATVQVLPAAGDEVFAEATADLEIVRLGIDRIDLASGAIGKRIDLLWAEMDGVAEGYYLAERDQTPWSLERDAGEPAAAVDLELADGSPRESPAPWVDLKSPPLDDASTDGAEHDTYDLPTAWVAGSVIDVSARLSSDVAGAPGGGAPVESEVRVAAPPGTRLVGSGAFASGGTVVVRPEASPVPSVARYDWTLEWRFEARRGSGAWVPVPGSLVTVHRLYGVAGVPKFRSGAVPHRAWVEVLDLVTGWVDGAGTDGPTVAGRIVEGVYNELGLRYDDVFGGSAYTEYLDGWNGGVFHIVAFQRRDDGSVVNCSDAAGIVSAYANMVGVDLSYHIIEHPTAGGFDLNYIRPIGFTAFDETPFRSGGGSFSYHAVTGPADGTVYDATLALDGDGDPGAPPHTALLATGLPPDEYLFDLTSQWDEVIIHIDDTVTLQ
ncbi:MAG: hypothetical protein HY905_18875 [Deltaproteobacteria bacterium]|nr:hypothetical protein [Deltaproteobacteria bacterium]